MGGNEAALRSFKASETGSSDWMGEDEFALKAARLRAARKIVRKLRKRAAQIGLVIESMLARGADPSRARERLGETMRSLAEAIFLTEVLSRQLGQPA